MLLEAVMPISSPTPQARPLSPRERQLVLAVADGCTNKEIAARLGLSVQTVKNQLSKIYAKVGVSTRLELAVRAVRVRDLLD